MPRLSRTIVPRIRKSLEKRGFSGTLWRCLRGPFILYNQYVKNRKHYVHQQVNDEFDRTHGIETSKRVALSDLKVDSPNWLYCEGYWPTPPEVFRAALKSVTSRYEDLTFIDFGSGKGRVLLMASEFPFRKIIGVEFSSDLHKIAEENIARYKSASQKCKDIVPICGDFTQIPIPAEPLLVFLYNPSSYEITAALAHNVAESVSRTPRELWVIYVTPAYDVFESGKPLALHKIHSTSKYAVYANDLALRANGLQTGRTNAAI